MLSQWGQDPLQGNPRYTSIRTLNCSGRTFLQLALDSTTGDKVAIKFTQRGETLQGLLTPRKRVQLQFPLPIYWFAACLVAGRDCWGWCWHSSVR
jgi:hypothetical protein